MVQRVRLWGAILSVLALSTATLMLAGIGAQAASSTGHDEYAHYALNCKYSGVCVEVGPKKQVWGNYYVGQDEPSMLFYSNTPGAGNHARYEVTLPTEPSASAPNKVGKSYTFELSGAMWFGMAICDTQSYPEQVTTCPRDSDKNILDPAISPKHVGEAYLELQFYPPGWVPWPTWAVANGASSCDPTHWCAAMNIDSLSYNPVTNQLNNNACLSTVGEEYVNFAFITRSGVAQAPANPVDATLATYTPDPTKDLFMNPGDHVQLSLGDTKSGLRVVLNDLTTGQSGSMTSSAANGFGQVLFDPTGTTCTNLPYNFHPMYSTSSPATRVTWAAGSYNVAFDTELGHFQFCKGPYKIPATPFGLDRNGNPTICPATDTEGLGLNAVPSDNDDFFCFPAKEALVYKVAGCAYANLGFDGTSYQALWPNGNTKMHPTPFEFSSPLTGSGYNVPYSQAAFEADLPTIESTCNTSTGAGCSLIPQTDEGQPAAFYPFYSTHQVSGGCVWEFGNDGNPGQLSDFGQNGQYGTLLQQDYTQQGGSTYTAYYDFRNVLSNNPC